MNSRGNNLLLEEKERSKVNKALPRLEQVRFPCFLLLSGADDFDFRSFTISSPPGRPPRAGSSWSGAPTSPPSSRTRSVWVDLGGNFSMIQLDTLERAAPPGPGGGKAGQGEGQEGDSSPRDKVRCQALHPCQVERFVFQCPLPLNSNFSNLQPSTTPRPPGRCPPPPRTWSDPTLPVSHRKW